MAEKTRVIVVDDHALLRRGVVRALELDDTIEVVAEGASATDAIELTRMHAPDLILLDISMPGNGLEAARAIRDLAIPTRIVMLTVSGDETDVTHALEAGAVGYLLKGTDAQNLVTAVESVKAGDSFISPNLALRILSDNAQVKANPLSSLSEFEKHTLSLISEGLTNREIGEQLAVTEKTVHDNVTDIFRKLKARSRTEAALVVKQVWAEFHSRVSLH
jgi:two-component system nitrate/nitrite response regulator NarL